MVLENRVVVSPMEDTPGFKAGILSGDRIVETYFPFLPQHHDGRRRDREEQQDEAAAAGRTARSLDAEGSARVQPAETARSTEDAHVASTSVARGISELYCPENPTLTSWHREAL